VFSAGLTIERRVAKRSWISIATLLLVVVMPLTILAIAAFGEWLMGLPFGAALLARR
jgi:NhaP-type Na+/H+ or K+/H+ antiporter